MTSASVTQSSAPRMAGGPLNLYLRAVWARLAAGSVVAALAAWALAMAPPLRARVLIEQGEASIGLTLAGVALAAAPLIIWAAARVFARGPNLINPVWFWLFAVAAGAGANTLALLFLRDSVVSVFALAAAGFGAAYLAHRFVRQAPAWTMALLFLAVGIGGEGMINAVLPSSWPFTVLDLAAIVLVALLIVLRAPAFARIQQNLSRPNAKAGVTYGAMHLITLAQAASDQPAATIK